LQPDRRDAALLLDMMQFPDEVRQIVAGAGMTNYLADLATRRALERCVELIGEAASHVSDAFQAAHPEIPWREIIAQRHRLIHGYRDVDPERIRNVVESRVPALLHAIESLLPPVPADPEPEP
jgi:uncharacterized protein with HEPN domain